MRGSDESMMKERIVISGGYKLQGTVNISGAKNAAVALLPAAILADDEVIISGVPRISDIDYLCELLKELNCTIIRDKDCITIDSKNFENTPLVKRSVDKLRASYYFMGAILTKCKKVVIRSSGGCYLGPRPIDLHLKGFEALGAKIDYKNDTYTITAEKLQGAKIYLDFASVGATINILLAAVKAEGKTIIENAAKEPEIVDVANLLTKMGAKIQGAGTDKIIIEGVDCMHGCIHEMIPDRIEAGTFLIIAAAVGKKITIKNIIPHHLESLTSKLFEMGVKIDIQNDQIVVYENEKGLEPVNVITQIYPGFATDLQQPLTALLTQCTGKSKVIDTIYPERFGHCEQLNCMGANINKMDGECEIMGPTKLSGRRVYATDLRCGAALLIAGLLAQGETEICNVYHIDRGYANIDKKLISLGAVIRREYK